LIGQQAHRLEQGRNTPDRDSDGEETGLRKLKKRGVIGLTKRVLESERAALACVQDYADVSCPGKKCPCFLLFSCACGSEEKAVEELRAMKSKAAGLRKQKRVPLPRPPPPRKKSSPPLSPSLSLPPLSSPGPPSPHTPPEKDMLQIPLSPGQIELIEEPTIPPPLTPKAPTIEIFIERTFKEDKFAPFHSLTLKQSTMTSFL